MATRLVICPRGLPEREWDWEAIQKLLEELKVPILKTGEDYRKAYREAITKTEQGSQNLRRK